MIRAMCAARGAICRKFFEFKAAKSSNKFSSCDAIRLWFHFYKTDRHSNAQTEPLHRGITFLLISQCNSKYFQQVDYSSVTRLNDVLMRLSIDKMWFNWVRLFPVPFHSKLIIIIIINDNLFPFHFIKYMIAILIWFVFFVGFFNFFYFFLYYLDDSNFWLNINWFAPNVYQPLHTRLSPLARPLHRPFGNLDRADDGVKFTEIVTEWHGGSWAQFFPIKSKPSKYGTSVS